MKLMKKVYGAKQGLSRKLYMMMTAAGMAFMATPIPAFAAKKKSGTGKSMVGDLVNGEGNGAFDNATKVTKDVGASAYILMRNIGAACLVLSIVVLGLTLALHAGNTQKAAEGKDTVVKIVIGACFVFGAMSILSIIVGVAGSI